MQALHANIVHDKCDSYISYRPFPNVFKPRRPTQILYFLVIDMEILQHMLNTHNYSALCISSHCDRDNFETLLMT